jgi:hypothetical protein
LSAVEPPQSGRHGSTNAPKGFGGALKKIAALAAILVIVLALGYGGYWLYNNYTAPEAEVIPENSDTPITEEPINEQVEEVEEPSVNEQPETRSETRTTAQDSDQDGLSDEEEQALGTNPATVDSDQDGLFDWEEVKVYETDPLASDSDGDGYLDGDEVDSGFDPLGPGKLFEIEQGEQGEGN